MSIDGGAGRDDQAEKISVTPVGRLRVPIGGQELELQQIDYIHGGISQLRVRIREGKRFTVFDIDPVTAREWGALMVEWADARLADAAAGGR